MSSSSDPSTAASAKSSRETELQALLARVEAATGWDDDLDVLLFMDVDPEYGRERKIAKVKSRNYPQYTASLDAALALASRLLPGWAWMTGCAEGGDFFCSLQPSIGDDPFNGEGDDGDASTAPLAVLAALLKVLAAQAASPAAGTDRGVRNPSHDHV
jgi:hypothetical protein